MRDITVAERRWFLACFKEKHVAVGIDDGERSSIFDCEDTFFVEVTCGFAEVA